MSEPRSGPKFGLVAGTGLMVGLLGVVGPIAWDYYKTKSGIELRVIDKSVIISKPKKLDGLTITYMGEPLEELAKASFSLTNSGRTPVLKKDIAAPIQLKFASESNIIDAKIDGLQPVDLGATLQFNRSEGTIVLDFALLNPGDRIEFSVLAKTSDVRFDATGRIAGVPALQIVRDVVHRDPGKSIPKAVYLVGFFAGLLALGAITLLTRLPAERRFKQLFEEGKFDLPDYKSSEEWVAWANTTFRFAISSDRAPLVRYLEHLPQNVDLTTEQRAEVMKRIRELLRQTANLEGALGTLLFVGLGVWYIVEQLR